MSSGAIDPIAQSKRVFFHADTTTASLKVGQPVCYNSDSVLDHKKRTSDPAHIGITQHTYAEGAQDFTGRLFVVEEPLSANLHAFAGIVKALGPLAGADGDMIEIWVPNGAVLPCWIDQSVTTDQTVLGIRNSVANVSYPGTPIGIAKETINRTTAGLCWVKVDPNMFLYQYPNTNLSVGASVTDLHHSRVTSAATTGFDHLDLRTTLTGTITSGNFKGILSYMDLSGSMADGYIASLHGQLNLSGVITGSGTMLFGVMAQVHGSPTFTECSHVAAIWADTILGVAPTAGFCEVVYMSHNGAAQLDQIVYMYGNAKVDYIWRMDACQDGAAANAIEGCLCDGTKSYDAGDVAIRVNIDGDVFYIFASDSNA